MTEKIDVLLVGPPKSVVVNGLTAAFNLTRLADVKDEAKFSGRDVDGTFHFPGFDPDAAEWMIKERRVAGIAVDTLSLDNGPSKDFKTHKIWLPSGRWGLENVANLGQVPAGGATLVVGAPKVRDATGGLTRVLALV